MKLVRLGMVVAALVALGAIPARTQDFQSELQRATQREVTTGDLGAVAREYLSLATRAEASNRAVAASALLRAADVYRKLGDGQARALYERVATTFPDQPAAASARLRLGSQAGRTAPSLLWAQARVDAFGNGRVSPDGRHLAYVDWSSGDLALRDLSAHTDRRLTDTADLRSPKTQVYAGRSVFSPDGTSVAHAWFNGARYEIRIAPIGESGIPSATVVFHNEEVEWARPDDWSPDGRWLVLQLRRLDRTGQIALLDLRDRTLMILKSFPWDAPSHGVRFSPDGRHLAFDLRGSQTSPQRDVYLLAVDGSRETPAVVHPGDDKMFEWSPDGRSLLFWSDRNGPVDLWAVDVADGRPSSTPRLVRSRVGEAGRFAPLGFDRNGALHYAASRSTDSGLRLADMDFATVRLTSVPRDAGLELGAINQATSPAWSSKGNTLAVLRRVRPGMESPFLLTTKDMTSGAVQETRPPLGACSSLQWSSDDTFFVCHGVDLKDRQGILRIESHSSSVTFLAEGYAPALSRDGRTLYLLRVDVTQQDPPHVIIERSIPAGTERELLRRGAALAGLRLSPDGRFLATVATDERRGTSALLVVPAGGGQPRTLLTEPLGEHLDASSMFWAPNGRSIFITRASAGSGGALLRVGFDGTVTTHAGLTLGSNVQVHPNGRQIAYFTGVENVTDVFRLDGLLAVSASR